jgi:hypothetical protein
MPFYEYYYHVGDSDQGAATANPTCPIALQRITTNFEKKRGKTDFASQIGDKDDPELEWERECDGMGE